MTDTEIATDDLNLMRWWDGDLAEDESEAFTARLASDADLQAKLTGLEAIGAWVEEESDGRADGLRPDQLDLADTIADRVMAALENDAGAAQSAAPTPVVGGSTTAANDNARLIFALAAGAAAMAGGLFLWGSNPADDEVATRPPRRAPPVAYASQDAAPSAPPAEAVIGRAPPEADESGAVEVASVDFGSHSGSVFGVGDDSTVVVWVTDSGDEP
ncbi:MAG: hypothetical protein AAGA56_16615 [Myxococcota bacterium]